MLASAILEIGRRGGIELCADAAVSCSCLGAAKEEKAETAFIISEIFIFSGKIEERFKFFSAGISDIGLSPKSDINGVSFEKSSAGFPFLPFICVISKISNKIISIMGYSFFIVSKGSARGIYMN